MDILALVFVAAAGALNALQSGTNAQLVRSLDRPWAAALLVSLATAACCVAALLVAREALPDGGRVAGAPWWAWTGGLCGALFVTGTLFFARKATPGLAASVLAISEPVVEAHYNRARQDEAARRFQENLRKERARTAPGPEARSRPAANGQGRTSPGAGAARRRSAAVLSAHRGPARRRRPRARASRGRAPRPATVGRPPHRGTRAGRAPAGAGRAAVRRGET